jgi:hypothetical protein
VVGAGQLGMNHYRMTQSKKPPRPADASRSPDKAFDIWLNRGLHQLFDDIANEPVPDELLRLIEEDRSK